MPARRSALPVGLLALLLGAWLACRPAATERPRPPRPAPPLPASGEVASDAPSPGAAGNPAGTVSAAPGSIRSDPVGAESSSGGGGVAAEAIDILPVQPPAPLADVPRPPPQLPTAVRVGLESDLDVVSLPCCSAQLEVRALGETIAAARGVTIRPAPQAAGRGIFRLQVAALRDETQSRQLANRLGSALGVDADVVFDAGSGLHKVRVGSYPDRPSAEGGKRRLLELGVPGAFTVHEDRGLEAAGLVIELGSGQPARLATRAVELIAPGGLVRYRGKPYRGRLRIFLNQRGLLNVINDLDLESYLRGVVPMELGPELYPELDALRAQAVAARTYTMRNLERFEEDGYDICATPRCQVYGGVAVEHPLSDRAIAETAGEVALFEGEAIDALYSSTCGGRTESVSWVFPDKHEPYLASVPCAEGGGRRFGSAAAQRDTLASWLLEVTLGRIAGDERARLEERVRRLAQLVAVPRPGEHLASLERSEVGRFVASQLDLPLDARLLLAADGGPPTSGWSRPDRWLPGLLEPHGGGKPAAATLDAIEAEQIALELVRYFGAFQRIEGGFQQLGEGEIEIASGPSVSRLPLAASVGGWRRRATPPRSGQPEADRVEPVQLQPGSLEPERFDGDRPVAGALELVPGDPVDLYLVRGAVIAVVQHADTVGAAAAVRPDRQRWTRFRSTARVGGLVRQRFPGFELADLVVLERGASGRVASLELVARDGRREILAGLPIRWTLEVPDTWFELTRTRSRAGEDGWLVEGRGWGHGVGMCQVGAFAMARRGHDYREILEHYYRGVEVRRLTAWSSPIATGP